MYNLSKGGILMGFIDDAKDNVSDAADDMRDRAQDMGDDTQDRVGDMKDKLKEGADEAGEHIDAWMDKSQGDHKDELGNEDRMSADELEEKTHGRDF